MRASWIAAGLAVVAIFARAAHPSETFLLDRATAGRTAIVLPAADRSSEDDRLAARELQSVLKKALGIELRIIDEAAARDLRGFHIGKTWAFDAAAFSGEPSEGDVILIDIGRDRVLLAGNRPVATRYAVYRFLDKHLGVRWYMPGDLGEHIPAQPSLSLPLGKTSESARFDYRHYAYVGAGRTSSYPGPGDPVHGADIWAARNLLSVDRTSRSIGSGHNLDRIFDPDSLFESHPEVFPLHHGRRHRPRAELTDVEAAHFTRDPNWQPCFSHPTSVRLAIEAARRHFDARPKAEAFSLAINDSYSPESAWCTCEACLEANGPDRDFHGLRVWSNAYFRFINRVAREIAKSHPGRRIGVLAYLNVESPPDFPLEENVTVWLTQDTAQYHDRGYEHEDLIALARWSRVCRDLAKYDYYSLQWALPRYFPAEIRRDLAFTSALGIRKYHIEDVPCWPLMGPMLWIAGRLLWDPDQDVAALQSEFCRDLFGRAAPDMNRFFAELQSTWQTTRSGRWFEGLSDIRSQLRLYPADRIRELTALLERAASAERTGLGAERVAFFRRGWATCVLLSEERDLADRLDRALLEGAVSSAVLDRISTELREATRRRRSGFAVLYPDPLLGGSAEWAFEVLKRAARWDDWIESLHRRAGLAPHLRSRK